MISDMLSAGEFSELDVDELEAQLEVRPSEGLLYFENTSTFCCVLFVVSC